MRGLGLVEKCQFSFHVYLFLHKLTSKYSVSHVSDFQECRESPNVFFFFIFKRSEKIFHQREVKFWKKVRPETMNGKGQSFFSAGKNSKLCNSETSSLIIFFSEAAHLWKRPRMPNRVVSRFANEKLERQNHSTFQFLVSNRLDAIIHKANALSHFCFQKCEVQSFQKRDRESRRDESLVRFFVIFSTSFGKRVFIWKSFDFIYFHKSFHLFLSNSSCLVLLRLRVR